MYQTIAKSMCAAMGHKETSVTVTCEKCLRTRRVDSTKCLAFGWPECCGHTMTLDTPNSHRKQVGE